MRSGRFHCALGPILSSEDSQKIRQEFLARRKAPPPAGLLAEVDILTDRRGCPHRYRLAKGRDYCACYGYLKHFVKKPAETCPAEI